MKRSPQLIGGLIGVAAALLVLGMRAGRPEPQGVMLSECDGAIRELVIHYVAGDTIASPVYAQFLPLLAGEVTVRVVCPDRAAFDELLTKVGPVACRLCPLVVDHPITVWSRDRWVATQAGDAVTLLSPADEAGAAIWPQRAGDAQTAADIARLMGPGVRFRKLGVYFDGGDLMADGNNVFVNSAIRMKNLGRTTDDSDQLGSLLARELGRPIIMLDPTPDHHMGMFMVAAGGKTMLVGDPSMVVGLYGSDDLPELPDGVDLSEATQHIFDSVAAQVAAAGYRVVRIPVLPSTDGKTYMTYVNCITDFRDGKRIVYMPVYPNAPDLNELASQTWRSVGFEVHPIDVGSCYEHFGTLHCLVNVLRRG